MLNKLFKHDIPERDDGFVPVARFSDLKTGQLKRVIVKGQAIVITLVAQSGNPDTTDVVAFVSMCPHALGDLSQGWVDTDEVECPVHYYRFNMRTGDCHYPKGGPKLRTCSVTLEGNQVLVKVEQPKWIDGAER